MPVLRSTGAGHARSRGIGGARRPEFPQRFAVEPRRACRCGADRVPVEPSPAEFVSALLPEAKAAGRALGVEPRLLLAQAALETGWGRAMPQRGDESAHNLFGIKAGASWSGAAVEQWTLEHPDGVTARQRERFRAYGNTAESFADYVVCSRRRGAIPTPSSQADDPEAYARAVTKAGYATDPVTRTSGSRSITAIVSSKRCAASIRRLRHPEQPT